MNSCKTAYMLQAEKKCHKDSSIYLSLLVKLRQKNKKYYIFK